MSVWLIYNFGTQEPRILCEGDYLLLKDAQKSNPLRRMLAGNDIRAGIGLWENAQRVLESPAKFDLSFPILRPAVAYARTHGQLTQIRIIATAASTHTGLDPDDPRHDDTLHAAHLARNWLLASDPAISPESVQIIVIEDNDPHLYGNAKRKLAVSGLLSGLEPAARICVCNSPGLPAVNSAVLQFILHDHAGQAAVFQIQQPSKPNLLRGESGMPESVAETEILLDLGLKQLLTLIERFQYQSAIDLLDRLPLGVGQSRAEIRDLLKDALNQWSLNPSYLAQLAPGMPWTPFLLRAYAGIRLGEALLAQHLDEAIAWLGDTYEFVRDLLYAFLNKDSTLLEGQKILARKKQDKTPVSDWQTICAKAPEFASFWSDLGRFGIVQKFRNSFVHRLQPSDPAAMTVSLRDASVLTKSETVENLPGKLITRLDFIVRELHLGDPETWKGLVPPFAAINETLVAKIRRDLHLSEYPASQ